MTTAERLGRVPFLLTSLLLLGALALSPTRAEAALTKSQQRCVKVQNTNLRKVVAQIGKRLSACVKRIGNGQDPRTLSACVSADDQGRIARATAKTAADDVRLCQGSDSHGDPKMPPVFYGGAASTNAAATAAAMTTIPTVFGATEAVLSPASEAEGLGFDCQQAVVSSLQRCQAAILVAFEKCKKSALQTGASTPAELASCLGSDPRGAVSAACIEDFDALLDSAGQCTAAGITMAFVDSYSGVCPCATPFDIACLHRCLARPTTCAVCSAISDTDVLGANCDTYDDGLANGSCGSTSLAFVDPPSSLLR